MGDLWNCSVCLSRLEDPHILPSCGHTFCLACIESLQNKPPPRCPLCREAFNPRQVRPNYALQNFFEDSEESNPTVTADPRNRRVSVSRRSRLSVDMRNRGTEVGATLRKLGLPPAFADLLAEEDADISLRIYVLDNSGSMANGSEHVLTQDAAGLAEFRIGTRWDELKAFAMRHARWNAELGVPCEFMLLNPSSPDGVPHEGRDILLIDGKGSSPIHSQMKDLETMLRSTWPQGGTPLTERLEQIRQRLLRRHRRLAVGLARRVMLILATDGEPWGGHENFVNKLRLITDELPVNIVIRLCTDDEEVVDYYNKIDEEVELPLDIVDDLYTEAQGVCKLNPWLTYSYVLHMVREAGTLTKILDWLDERPLTPLEVSLVAYLFLWREGAPRYPNQPDAFLEAVERDLPGAQTVFDGSTGTWGPPIQLLDLKLAINPSKHTLLGQTLYTLGLGAIANWYYTGRRPCSATPYQPLATILTYPSSSSGSNSRGSIFRSPTNVREDKRNSEERRNALKPAVAALPLPLGLVAPDAPVAPVDLDVPRPSMEEQLKEEKLKELSEKLKEPKNS